MISKTVDSTKFYFDRPLGLSMRVHAIDLKVKEGKVSLSSPLGTPRIYINDSFSCILAVIIKPRLQSYAKI